MSGVYLTPWQKIVRGFEKITPKPIKDGEASQFYWCSEVNVSEISEAYFDSSHVRTFIEFVGPAVLEGQACKKCSGPVYVFSRQDAIYRATWNREPVCKQCHTSMTNDASAEFAERLRQREARLKELRYMPYREYLQTPEWKAKREGALKRAKYSCQTCGTGGKLHVHHRTYARRGDEWNADLIALCEECHRIFHENGKLSEKGRAA